MKRLSITIFLLILVFSATWIIANRKHVFSFTTILSSYYAKEYCSCRFVTNRNKDECHEVVRSWIEISSFKENLESKTITVSGLGQTNEAKFIDAKTGCILINPVLN